MGLTRMLGVILCCAFFQPAHAVETIETGMPGAANAIMWPWYIGISNGFFAAAGIALDVIYVPTPTGLMQQLTAGSLDIVADIGVVEPIHAVSKGAPVALLRITGAVPPYEMVAQPAIKSLRDLSGKTVVIGGLVDINRVYLERVMRANGLKDGDYDITVIGNTAGRFAALRAGAADATMLSPPVNFYAEGQGFTNVGMVIDYAKDLPFSGADVSLAYAGKHRATLMKLLAVLDQSVAWFADDANRDRAIDILADQMKIGRADVARGYDYMRKIDFFARDNVVPRSRVENLMTAMKALGDTDVSTTVDKLVIPGLTRIGE